MFGRIKRWMYRDNRPNWIAKLLNWGWGKLHGAGLTPLDWVELEVVGRKSGRLIAFPVVISRVDGVRYIVSMLGKDANWVRNVRAAGGAAGIRSGHTESVQLEEIPVEHRAPILKAYLQAAPGARPHIPVDKDAPVEAFSSVANDYPVFKVISANLPETS